MYPTNGIEKQILLLEDDPLFLETLRLEFEERGYRALTASSLEEVKEMQGIRPRFAIIDLRLRAETGIVAVEYLKEQFPECRSIILTGYGSISTAVEAVKKGAAQYVTKPIGIEKLERLLWSDQIESEDHSLGESLARREREYIEWTLQQTQGNISAAAKRLGIHRQSLQRKLRKFSPK